MLSSITSRRTKRLAGVAIVAIALSSVPVASHAWGFSIAGASAGTYQTRYGADTGLWLQDTAADNKRAEARFKRSSGANPTTYLANTGGKGANRYHEAPGRIVLMQLCTLNNNPFDSQYCSSWYYG